MISTTATFLERITTSHTLATQVTVIEGDGTRTTIPVLDGTVTLDQNAAVRGRCDLTLTGLDLVPDTAQALLAPYGNEIQVSRGITYPDGTTELVSLGVFGIQDTDITDDAAGLTVRVTGLDRAQRIIDARFEEPYNVASGVNYATAILTVIQAAYPDVDSDLTATAHTTPSLIAKEGDDRWKFAQDMATSIAMRLHFDGEGVLRLVPSVLSSPVADIEEGEGGVLVTAGRRWTRQGSFNRVIATGENTSETPARGVATDENPFSPTYYYGPFGRVPRFYSSPFITNDAQAASAAQKLLDDELGTSEQVSFGSFVLPHLEPGDTVRITRARAGINEEDHIIDSLTIPLSAAGVMSGQTRARQVT